VSTQGTWEDGDRYGALRFVVTTRGFDHLSNGLYVQWLDYDETTTVRAEIAVAELNDGFWYLFGPPTCDTPACDVISVATTHKHSMQERAARITLSEIGAYEFAWLN
jgi:hypothetical protein